MNGLYKRIFPVAQSSIPRSSLYYEPLKTKYPYNPDKAKALLAGRTFNIKMSTANLFSHQKEVDQAIAQYLGKVGITVDTTELEAGAFRTTYNQYDLSLNTLASFTMDPDFILSLYTGGIAEAVWHLRSEDRRLNTAQRTTVGPARQAKVTAMAKYLFVRRPRSTSPTRSGTSSSPPRSRTTSAHPWSGNSWPQERGLRRDHQAVVTSGGPGMEGAPLTGRPPRRGPPSECSIR